MDYVDQALAYNKPFIIILLRFNFTLLFKSIHKKGILDSPNLLVTLYHCTQW